ncbi:MAG: hypothetical protein GC185_08475 [Alphaproteobacteria bacterium]|nr:hypothetical protein [Alphaproteobacteria bacterium]
MFGLNLGMGIDLLSFCAACMVNAVQRKFDRADGDRLSHASSLAKAVNLDMAAWYTPTAESYFGRIGKQRILDELAEARKSENAPAWAKLKKAELAKLAEREVNGTGWLPEILRS